MKIKRVLMLLSVFLVMPLVLSVEIDLSKDSYYGLETLQAEINGNFISLDSGNIGIYENGKVSPEAVLSGLIKRGDKYYFYAVLPERAGNFSLKIENVQYIESRHLIDEEISKEFVILDNNGSILSVNPGFIIVEDEFEIGVVSYGGNQEVNAVFEGNGKGQIVSLIDSVEKKIKFSVLDVSGIESSLNIGDYNVPVFLLKGFEGKVVNEAKINIVALDLKGNLNRNEDYTFEIVLENVGNVNLSDVKLSSDFGFLFEPKSFDYVIVGEKKIVNVIVPRAENFDNVSGEIRVGYGDAYSSLPLYFNVNDEGVVNVENNSSVAKSKDFSCYDIGGEVCYDKKCNENTVASLDGPCCLSECIEEKGFNWWAMGLLILIILGIFIAYFYKRLKKKQVFKSSEEVLKDKSEQFQKRMRGSEVSKRLDRI